MFYFLITFAALFTAFISFSATKNITETTLITAALLGLSIVIKWLFFSNTQNKHKQQSQQTQPQKPQKQSQITKTQQEETIQQKPENNNKTTQGGVYEWPETGKYEFEIVGESYYQPAISKIYQSWISIYQTGDIIQPLDAYLIPDNDNKYDDKAVRIDINNHTVGHLNRDNARSFRRRLGAKKMTGKITKCKAIITGGHTLKDGKTAHYGVILDLKPFE